MKIALRCAWNLQSVQFYGAKPPVPVFAPKISQSLVRRDLTSNTCPSRIGLNKFNSISKFVLNKKFIICRNSSSSSIDLYSDMDNPSVSAEWLNNNLNNVKILDASWYMPAEKRNPREEFENERIPGALFFDIDKIADQDTDLPHMLPSEASFSDSVSKLGLNSDDSIVVYDKKGIFSAARAWWTFRVFGHEKIKVLEGGFPSWRDSNFKIENQKFNYSNIEKGDFKAKLNSNLVQTLDEVLENLEKEKFQVVDARPKERFFGIADEPRKGVKKGHIPKSFNVPFPQVLTENGFFKNEKEIKNAFGNSGLDLEREIVASCGTGVTACVLALALYKIGKRDVAVYDGSWTEWGTRSDVPIETS